MQIVLKSKKKIFIFLLIFLIQNNPYAFSSEKTQVFFKKNTLKHIFPEKAKGPFSTRNLYPPLILFLNIPNSLTKDIKNKSFYSEFNIYHTNVFSGETVEFGKVYFDMETSRITNRFFFALTNKIYIGIEISSMYNWGGFGDPAFQKFHHFFNFPNQNRESRPNNDFGYLIDLKNNKNTVNNPGLKQFGLGDTSLFLEYSDYVRLNDFKWGVISAIKMPTGNSEKLHGSGKYDFGLGFFMKKYYKKIVLYSITGGIFPGTPSFALNNQIESFFTETVLSEYLFSDTLSFLLQFDYNSNPFVSGVQKLDQSSLEIIFGLKKIFFNNTILSFSINENLTRHTTVDLMANIGIGTFF